MRFVAGRGAVAYRLQRGGAVAEMLAAAWRIAIGKKLLPGRTIGKKMLAGDAVAERLSGCAEEVLLAGAPWQSCRLAGAPPQTGTAAVGAPSGRT